jgi:hypothetical protein
MVWSGKAILTRAPPCRATKNPTPRSSKPPAPADHRPVGSGEPMPGTAVLDPKAPLTLGHLWSALGAGGAQPLVQVDAGGQQAADGERD